MKEKERQALFELLKLLEIYEDIDILLERLIYYICELMNAQCGFIGLIKNQELHIAASYNISSDKSIIKIDEGICGEVLKEGKVKIFNRVQLEGKQLDISAYSAICIPLKIKEEIIGTIVVYNKMQKYFSDDTTAKSLTFHEEKFSEFDEEDISIGEIFSAVGSLIILQSLKCNELKEREIHTMKLIAQSEKLKSYLESLIQSSADAIIATDMDNIVTAWNKGAENIFGYTNKEVIEKPLPIIPDFLREMEKIYFERIRNGEILKNIETIMVTKEGKLIEVSLTMSPIKSSNGEILGVSRIIRDITEKKKLERDLLRRNEELTKILFISSAVRSTLDFNKLLRMILTVITMGEGLGFNRAALFLVDEESDALKGVMAVGPSSYEEAWQIWSSMAREKKSLFEVLDELNKREFEEDSLLDRLCRNISIPLRDNTPLVRAIKERKVFNIKDIHKEESDPVIVQQLGSFAYAIIPLVSKDKAIGAVWVDNLYTRKPITEQDIHFLKGFADQVAGAIENAWIFDKVEKAEKELEMLFNSITDLIYYTDENYIIKKVNQSFLNAIGLKEHEVIGKRCFELIHRTNYPSQECPHRKTIETGRPHVLELEENYLEGIYLVSSSPIFDRNNNLIGTVNVAKNITELRKLRERIISMEKMATLGEMAARVAHEIRNPLLAIGGFAKRLDKYIKEEKYKEYVKIIIEEVKRLEKILNEILGFVKPYSINKESFKIKGLIDNVINFVESTVKENNNEFRVIIEEDFEVSGNYDKLKEVLLNLISNANEATKNGLIMLKVKKADKLPLEIPDIQKEYLLIEVEDTGSGIQKENLKRIFDPFFTTKASGTGLGLAICKKIVEEHGGIIKVESEVNKGTIFRVYLPLSKKGEYNENLGS